MTSTGSNAIAGSHRRGRRAGPLALSAGLVLLCAPLSCSGPEAIADTVQPVRRIEDPDPTPGSAPTTDTTAAVTTDPAMDAPDGPAGVGADDTQSRALVDDLLLRYDDLVTRLAADPVAALDPMHPVRQEWNALVPVDTALSTDVVDQLVARPAAAGTRLVPGADGHSYRHRSLSVGPPVDGMVEFTWCGYSPGVRVDASSGRVVDDAVAYVHGSGRLMFEAGGWVIDALDHLRIDVRAPGSGDPCPAEQAAVAAAGPSGGGTR